MKMYQLCTRLNRRLLPVKIHYFLFFAALACVLPFRTVFAKQLGISATAVGVIFCTVPFLKLISHPLFGFILDYFKKIRITLSVIMVFVALSHVTMIFIPPRSILYQNSMNLSELDFFSKIKYSFVNATDTSDYNPSLIMQSELKLEEKYKVEKNIFTCNIICSDSTNIINDQDVEITSQCSKRISFDMKILVDISRCNMDVNLLSGKFFIASEDGKSPLSATINESSVILLKSWTMPVQNCSKIELKYFDSFIEKIREENRNNSEDQNLLKVGNVLKEKINDSFIAPDSSLSHRNIKQYYVQHRYSFEGNRTIFSNCPCSLEYTCQTKKCYSEIRRDDFLVKKFVGEVNEFLSAQFWGLFFLIVLSSVMFSAIIFLMDAVCYEMLQDNKDKYGQQRLWGTVGWGVGALAGGYLNQIARTESGEVDYALSFYLLTLLAFLDLIPIFSIKVTELKYSPHIWKDVWFLFTKISIVYNVTIVYIIGALSGFIWNYQFWFMEEIGSNQVLLGLSQIAEGTCELPWFILAGYIIGRIGHDHCNNVTLLCFGLRYLCFAFMYNPWWTLPAGLLHGPTFGLFYASMTMYAKIEAPPGTEATVQSLLHLFFEGIGIATGSVLGGVGIDKLGSRMAFKCAASVSFLILFINILKGIIVSRTKMNNKDLPNLTVSSSAVANK